MYRAAPLRHHWDKINRKVTTTTSLHPLLALKPGAPRCVSPRRKNKRLLILLFCQTTKLSRGSVIFKQFRHMENLPPPEVGILKNYPPVYVTGPKCNPPYPHPPPLRTRRASDCEIAYNTCSGRLPINQNPLQLIFVKAKNLWVLCALLQSNQVKRSRR